MTTVATARIAQVGDDAGGEAAARARHAAWAAELAEWAEPELTEANQQH